ncbi:hypothetical protein Pan241w_11110 [Gimesia alba]|uniref:Uncharacterized protein n=1 Tax=Gimesia alba TaxID=2527973 RepID=A0A517RAY7_9PLAN|nr:hypothetical protein [Gimesia alba]QDT41052.1 hypothetical protein Pan241w_11110 [Gimesia alba]
MTNLVKKTINELYEELKEEHHGKKYPYSDGSGYDITEVEFHEEEQVICVLLTDGGMFLQADYYWIDHDGVVRKDTSSSITSRLCPSEIAKYREILADPIKHSCGEWVVST